VFADEEGGGYLCKQLAGMCTRACARPQTAPCGHCCTACRPGDVLQTRAGITVENGNTDAEVTHACLVLTEARSTSHRLSIMYAQLNFCGLLLHPYLWPSALHPKPAHLLGRMFQQCGIFLKWRPLNAHLQLPSYPTEVSSLWLARVLLLDVCCILPAGSPHSV
jgi:hypothetical protein